jgi:putative transposase
MAETERMTADEVVAYRLEGEQGLDVLRESLCWMVAQLMEAEVGELVGAKRGERAPAQRLTHQNGYRSGRWQTRVGEIELQIPKIRRGSYFPSFLEPRRRCEQALVSVIQQAYVRGVSTRRVDQLVESLGLRVSRSEVSRICAGLDEQVEAFRTRPLEGRYPYLWLDAKVEKVRDGGRVVRKCLVIAQRVDDSGRREVIGLDCGEAETEVFWRDFLRSLVKRGLAGVELVISDAHEGLKNAIGQVLAAPGSAAASTSCAKRSATPAKNSNRCWPRSSAPSSTPKAALRRASCPARRCKRSSGHCQSRGAARARRGDLLAFYSFPQAHWRKLRSTNPLERLNREIGRRTDVVGIFPTTAR